MKSLSRIIQVAQGNHRGWKKKAVESGPEEEYCNRCGSDAHAGFEEEIVKECEQPLKAGKEKNGFFLRASGRQRTQSIPWFCALRLLRARTIR